MVVLGSGGRPLLKTEVLQGIKLPETLRKRRVKFSELVEDALAYSKTHKRSYRHDVCRAGILEEEFGSLDASSITHQGLNTFLQERGGRKSGRTQRTIVIAHSSHSSFGSELRTRRSQLTPPSCSNTDWSRLGGCVGSQRKKIARWWRCCTSDRNG